MKHKQNMPTKILAWQKDSNGKIRYCIAIRTENTVRVNMGKESYTMPAKDFECEGYYILA